MDACLYASDLNDAEWALLEPLVPRSHPAGRRQTYPLRRIVDAIFYLLRTGAQWRLLPHEYPPRVCRLLPLCSVARGRHLGARDPGPARELSPHDRPDRSAHSRDHRQPIGQDH